MEILLIVLGLFLLLGLIAGGFVLWGRKNPERAAKILMKSKKVREVSKTQLADELADDPAKFEEMASGMVGRDQARAVRAQLEGRNEAERRELIETITAAAESGKQLRPEDLARKTPRTADEARAKSKKKSKNRARRKQARKQRRR